MKKKISNCTNLCPCCKYSHPSQEQLIERSDTLLCFYLRFWSPSSSSVFTNVSVDHWLHLVEWVFAAWVIQLGVYHRALEYNKKKGRKVSKRHKYIQINQSKGQRITWICAEDTWFFITTSFKNSIISLGIFLQLLNGIKCR